MSVTSEMSLPSLFVGIDVSKDHLDLATSDSTVVLRFDNNPDGIARIVQQLLARMPTLVVLEATGKLELNLLNALLDAQIPVARVNPKRVRDFARSLGEQAKTDSIDAHVLVEFAKRIHPRQSEKRSQNEAELSELLTCRRQLIASRSTHSMQLKRTVSKDAGKCLQLTLKALEEQIEVLDEKIQKLIDSDDDMNSLQGLLRSVPGVGPVLAATIIGQLREIGTLEHKPLASLVGVAPFARDSGHLKGKRAIRGGRKAVRNSLYMAILSAVRFNPAIKTFYQRLINNGKETKKAMVAAINKLLKILTAIVRDRNPWNPNYA